ncbi:hypothetical protein [Kordiimonas aquimaris]|uniref:hypothetical protein n=1 Tax=Kordiimonas aquimaris TaxID=707591 RepID=UPI0021CF62A6|nr:hypothetical protein [Kordiimonas aquimaris]
MKLSVPTLPQLVKSGVQRAQLRLSLLLMLSLLYGLLSSIAVGPSQAVMTAFLENITTDTASDTSASSILLDGADAVLFGQALSLLVHAVLLVFWSRAVAKGNLVPNDGGPSALVTRSIRSFVHFLTATILSIIVVLGLATALYAATSLLGQLAVVLSFAGIVVGIWFIILANAVAQFAVFYEAQDIRSSFANVWLLIKPNAMPIAATFALYSFVALFVNLLISGILGQAVIDAAPYITLSISGGLSFAASAAYVAAISGLAKISN